jgi:hypothetical protein
LASAALAKRRGLTATKAAAKQRKQRIFVGVLAVVFALLLVYEVPRTLKLVGKSDGAPVVATQSVPATAPPSSDAVKRLDGSGNGADPFAIRGVPNGDTRVAPADGPDPFMAPAAATHAAPAPAAAALPQQIVIGRPGGNRVAKRGFIVILASIPTRNGRGDAISFARRARHNVGGLSILNSSHSRPLRGGYWVVYSGPYPTLGGVSKHAGEIHAAGYRTAYIRQLIAYK